MLSLLLLACATAPADTADTADTAEAGGGNLCGTVERPSDAPTGGEVAIGTVRQGHAACEDDTGLGGNWWGEQAAAPALVDETFAATLEPGAYGVEVIADGDWRGCEGVMITDTEPCAHEVVVQLDYDVPVDKPNVYLYPEAPLGVRVAIPPFRRITEADPDYPAGGWTVLARPDGRLWTAQGPRDYLFYELRWPADKLQTEEGWCSRGTEAQASIEDAMLQLGFLPNEIADFSEAWDPLFPRAEFMTVYPQWSLSALRVEPEPDHLLRVWFHVTEGCAAAEAPALEPVPRTGFHAAEWGVSFARPLDAGEVFVGGIGPG